MIAKWLLVVFSTIITVALWSEPVSSDGYFDTLSLGRPNVWPFPLAPPPWYSPLNAPAPPNKETLSASSKKWNREPLGPDFREPPALTDQTATTEEDDEQQPPPPPNHAADDDYDEDTAAAIDDAFFNPFSGGGGAGVGSGPGSFFNLFSRGGFMDFPRPWWQGANVCIEREESTENADDVDEDEATAEDDTTNAANEGAATAADLLRDTDNPKPKMALPEMVAPAAVARPVSANSFQHFTTTVSMSNCVQTRTKYECITKVNNHGQVKRLVVRYKCCHGYAHAQNGGGCTVKLDLQPLTTTLNSSGAGEFAHLLQAIRFDANMAAGGNYTMFAPSDDALALFNQQLMEMNVVDVTSRRRRDLMSVNTLVQRHISPGFVDLNEISSNDLLPTEATNNPIRINVFHVKNFDRMMTANCVRVQKSNIMATNGIVHILDGVMKPNTMTIHEILRTHPQLTVLYQVLGKTDLLEKLLSGDGHYTLFAPTDEAFAKLDADNREKLYRGDHCAKSILRHHIAPHVVCASILLSNTSVTNLEGQRVRLDRLPAAVLQATATNEVTDGSSSMAEDLLFEQTARLVHTDLMATNGVIHLIDTVVVPEAAQNIPDVLTNHNLTLFRGLLKEAGVDAARLTNVTIFAPHNRAFNTSAPLLAELRADPGKLRAFVDYHLVDGRLESCHMKNNALLKAKKTPDVAPVRLNLYSTMMFFTRVINRGTVNCVRISGYDARACNSAVHEIADFLRPPNQTLYEYIHSDADLSNLASLLVGTETEKLLQQHNASYTLLAATNEALPAEDVAHLKGDRNKVDRLMRQHLVNSVVCCNGVDGHNWNTVNAVNGERIPTRRTFGAMGAPGRSPSTEPDTTTVYFGDARVQRCDLMATNGVIHKVGKLVQPLKNPFSVLNGFFYLNF